MATNAYVSPDKIRLFLLDRSSADNFLLDDVDFSQESLDLAMELTVDLYNSTTPVLSNSYCVADFPFKIEFLLGVCAFLYKSKGLNLLRNALDYQSASGTAVNDKTKAEMYLRMAAEFRAEFDDRIKKIKQNENIESGYGFVAGYGI